MSEVVQQLNREVEAHHKSRNEVDVASQVDLSKIDTIRPSQQPPNEQHDGLMYSTKPKTFPFPTDRNFEVQFWSEETKGLQMHGLS